MTSLCQMEISLAFGERVAVEQYLVDAAFGWNAIHQRMLAAFAVAHEVSVASVAHGHGRVVLLDAAAHFGDQPFSELRRLAKGFFRVAVFRFQVAANFGIKDARIAHDVAPVGGAEPSVIVDQALAMNETLGWMRPCDRWSFGSRALLGARLTRHPFPLSA